jgi:tRNA modification GTPase
MSETDTIAAIATPNGKSALAIIRVSGQQAIDICASCIKETKLFLASDARRISLFTAIHPTSGIALDEITAIKYLRPQSFTGENMVEFICHGGPLIIRRIIEALLVAGARSAKRGEFTRRALLNGKIDMMRAEAIGGLIESISTIELSCAQKLFYGSSKKILRWKEMLVEMLAIVEAAIEFGEEEDIIEKKRSTKNIDSFLYEIKGDLKKREKIREIEERVKITIAGPTNAGKSTLFNLLLGHNRAIVHEEPGTTRDLVSEMVWIKNHEVSLIDSAGFRETENPIEREGIGRSKGAIREAAIVIWVTAANEEMKEWELKELRDLQEKRLICIINKIDIEDGKRKGKLLNEIEIYPICVSLKNGTNRDEIIEAIVQSNEEINENSELPDIFLNMRHEEIGNALYTELVAAKEFWDRPEIASHHIKNGIMKLDEFIGRSDNEEVLNKIFENFCIGK